MFNKAISWIRYFVIVFMMALAWSIPADTLPQPEDPATKYTVAIVYPDETIEVISPPTDWETANTIYYMLIGDGNAYKMFEIARK